MNCEDVKKYLDVLVNQKIQYVRRSCDLVDIGFGDLITRKDLKGKEITTARYALHLQCPFRITNANANEIITGSDDLLSSNFNEYEIADLNLKGTSVFDCKVDKLNDEFNNEYVKSISVNEYGDLSICLSNISISTFCVDGSEYESWRFFEVNKGRTHLVKNGTGFELE